jgi:RNA polymerase sigma factor (sigma-70 family)
MKNSYSDEELIEGLKQRKRASIELLYREFFPVIRHYLLHNSGNQQDAEDLFQDTMVVLYKQCSAEQFKLECSLKTYFMAISKNLWLQRLERKYRLLYQADFSVQESMPAYTAGDLELQDERLEEQRVFYKHLMLLPHDCRRVLQLYCLKIPYKEIARLLKFKDEIYVKTRKYFCKSLLRKKIMNDPDYKLFLEYDGNKNHLRLD